MDEIAVDAVADPSLDEPVFLEGLPGVAHVGALAARHLVDRFDGTVVRRVHSEHFPPQVTVEDGAPALTGSTVHAIDLDGRDALVLTGDHQPQTPMGHYRLTDAYLDVAEAFGARTVVAMGGVPTGELIESYDVLAVASEADLRDDLEAAGAAFRDDEPEGGIVGVSGLLVGLGARRGLSTACLMGETSGYLVDPKSATRVLEVLGSLLGVEIDTADLDERAEEMEAVVNRLREAEAGPQVEVPTDEDLRYIG
ncbi:MAG: proteasome assembly chaperone family protein [Halobacteriales archaeon]